MVAQPDILGKKVLLIDGDQLVRTALGLFLEDKGFEPTACATSREGVEAFNREVFDIILCDQCLPNQDCLEFFSFLGSSHPAVKRVLLISPKEAPHPADVLMGGVDAVIEKPLTAEIVGNCLAQMMEAAGCAEAIP